MTHPAAESTVHVDFADENEDAIDVAFTRHVLSHFRNTVHMGIDEKLRSKEAHPGEDIVEWAGL
jgi:hypothetical protein